MGGTNWTREEEIIFWLKLIPRSPKRLGQDITKNEEHSWGWVAQQMTKMMAGKTTREYTEQCVLEHYFQNCCGARFSPNAGKLPKKYWLHERDRRAAKAKAQAEAAAVKRNKASKKDPVAAANRDGPNAQTATGSQQAPIKIDDDCQYPNPRSHHAQLPSGRFTVPPSPSSRFASRGSLPAQYYPDRSLANHGRAENAEAVEDGLFVAQPAASWVDTEAFRASNHRQ
ncbi:uncharacterized protein THITE_2107265 [Thermothielavioides terrestris NRRL 8126]|uniref:Uncharacterized protein n=1 Tax=Thermothielavioides terrestris (strain ATCC 38088 / NRRL 8126) TaxID=578455 RepID=G2QTC5_THETT|nr:uncharacterized protein THITE_2107265 [Thermothielavioides terrestris NRRL 8126]AEO62742.1 hypothetical protein THITE_2107265 [Thermothielavioides terrestris NRRL 8126]